jgi:hypothetical protein
VCSASEELSYPAFRCCFAWLSQAGARIRRLQSKRAPDKRKAWLAQRNFRIEYIDHGSRRNGSKPHAISGKTKEVEQRCELS